LKLVAIDGVIKNQINTQQDTTPKGKRKVYLLYAVQTGTWAHLMKTGGSFPRGKAARE
jgi:hypothetical protein